jgi:hypothetical protein
LLCRAHARRDFRSSASECQVPDRLHRQRRNSFACCSAVMPMPVSETANSTKLLPLLTLRAAIPPGFLEYARTIRHAPGRGSVVGRVLLEGKPVHIIDVLADPEYTQHEQQKIARHRTFLCVPSAAAAWGPRSMRRGCTVRDNGKTKSFPYGLLNVPGGCGGAGGKYGLAV